MIKNIKKQEEIKSENSVEQILERLKEETRAELEKTQEKFEDYFVLRKVKGRVSIHVSKLGRSEAVKEKIKEVSKAIKEN